MKINTNLKLGACALVLSMSLGTATANPASSKDDSCEGYNCFSEAMETMPAIDMKEAPQVAWAGWSGGRSDSGSRSRGGSRSGYVGSPFGSFASVPEKGPVNSKGTVVFSPQNLTWAAYDSQGDLVKSGHASGGQSFCEDIGMPCRTPTGTFRVYAKGPADCISKKYPIGEGGAPMPHCMYFNGGYALHGSYYVPNFNASHGCIRVHPSAAAWLHQNFVKVGTVIKVQSY